jgi:hypothetical protein
LAKNIPPKYMRLMFLKRLWLQPKKMR